MRDNLLNLLAPAHVVFRLTGDTSLPGCGDDLRRVRMLINSLPISQRQRDALLHEAGKTRYRA